MRWSLTAYPQRSRQHTWKTWKPERTLQTGMHPYIRPYLWVRHVGRIQQPGKETMACTSGTCHVHVLYCAHSGPYRDAFRARSRNSIDPTTAYAVDPPSPAWFRRPRTNKSAPSNVFDGSCSTYTTSLPYASDASRPRTSETPFCTPTSWRTTMPMRLEDQAAFFLLSCSRMHAGVY